MHFAHIFDSGGEDKTIASVDLAHALAAAMTGRRPLIMDTDPQGTIASPLAAQPILAVVSDDQAMITLDRPSEEPQANRTDLNQ